MIAREIRLPMPAGITTCLLGMALMAAGCGHGGDTSGSGTTSSAGGSATTAGSSVESSSSTGGSGVTSSSTGGGTPLDGAPVITDVYPPTFAGYEAPTITAYLRATDLDGVASVKIGGVSGSKDAGGIWVAEGVPTDVAAAIEVTDTFGQVTLDTRTWPSTQPFLQALSSLTSEPGGTLLGWDSSHLAIVRFNPFGSPQTQVVSGPNKGSGAAFVNVGAMTAIGNTLYAVDGGTVVQVDLATGNRTAPASCMNASTGGFVAVPAPLRFYWSTGASIFRCDVGGAGPTMIGSLPITADTLVYDQVNARIVGSESNFGSIAAINLADNSVSLLNAATMSVQDGIRGLAVAAGQPYYMTYGNQLRMTTPDTLGQTLTTVGFNYPAGMAPCPDASHPEGLCVQSTGGSRMYRVTKSASTWTPTYLPFQNTIGTGGTVDPTSAVAVPSSPSFGSSALMVNSDGTLFRVDLSTGARTSMGTGFGELSNVLASGTVLSTDGRFFDALDPNPIFKTLPGAPIGLAALVPANTIMGEEAAVYRSSAQDQVRARGLTSGMDILLASGTVNAVTARGDGTVYFASFGPEIWEIAPGAGTATLLTTAPGVEMDRLYYDEDTHTLETGYVNVVVIDVQTLVSKSYYTYGLNVPISAYKFSRGPVPGTMIAADFFLSSVVVADLSHGTAFLLAR